MSEIKPINLLIERCADGDRAAFERLYQQTSPRLFGLLLKMLREPEPAEDILQDTFVQVWRRAASFQRDRGQGEAWLTSIARNRAIDWIRRSGRRPTLAANDELLNQEPSAAPTPDFQLASSEDTDRLNHCLEELKPQQQTGIRLAFIGGFSHREIADQLSTPLGTTKSWIKRGLEALKKCLTRSGVNQ